MITRLWQRSGLSGATLLQRLSGHSQLVDNTSWLMFDRVLRMGVGLVIGIWVARYLGPSQFGTYNYALALVALFGSVATLGLDGVVVREIVRSPASRHEVLGTAFLLRLAAGALSALLVVATVRLLRPGDPLTQSLVAILSLGAVFQALDAIDYWFQSQVQSKYSVWARNSAFLVLAAVRVVLLLTGAPLVAFVWAALGEIALGSIGLLLIYRWRGFRVSEWTASRGRAVSLLRASWPQVLGGMAILIYMKIDQVMLGEMIGEESVGVYAAAVRVSEVWYFVPAAIVSTMMPSLIQAQRTNPPLFWRRTSQLLRIMALLAYCIAIPLTFLAAPLVRLLYGSGYSPAAPILAVHVWAALFVFMGVAQGPWFLAQDLLKVALLRTVAGAVANVGLNLVLIPQYGGMGAAWATVASYAVSAFLMNGFDPRTRRLFALQARSLLPLPVRSLP